MLRKRATSSSSRCLRLVDLHSSMGNAKRCEGMERRGESQLEGEENKGGMEEEAPWVVDTGVGENVGRRTLLDCLLPPRPSLPLLSLPSVKGGRARALHPPFANSSSRSIPFYRERRQGAMGGGMDTDTRR